MRIQVDHWGNSVGDERDYARSRIASGKTGAILLIRQAIEWLGGKSDDVGPADPVGGAHAPIKSNEAPVVIKVEDSLENVEHRAAGTVHMDFNHGFMAHLLVDCRRAASFMATKSEFSLLGAGLLHCAQARRALIILNPRGNGVW